jgi:hypothetical protein
MFPYLAHIGPVPVSFHLSRGSPTDKAERELVFIKSLASFLVLLLTYAGAQAGSPLDDGKPIHIPLTMSQTRAGTYKATLTIGIGNLKPLPLVFDTGSTGLHVFAAANLDAPGSGVKFSQTPISFTVGNPGRITYRGVVCYAQLHFANFSTPTSVPIAYLTSASRTSTNPGGKIPDLHDPKAHGGYGVFGAGLTGPMPIPAPLLTLPAPFGSIYSIRLTRQSGELVLGSGEAPNAARFPLAPAAREGEKWAHGKASLLVNGRAIGTSVAISFDTGNGVPWIRAADMASIPQTNGLVAPSTRIGFCAPGDTREATSVTAGTSFANRIKLQSPRGAPLTNVGIEAFFDHVVTYDNVRGVISVAPSAPPHD